MAEIKLERRDSNGNIISKDTKNYHIAFNKKITIIKVDSYKKWNQLNNDENIEDLFFGNDTNGNDECERPKNKNSFIDRYNKKEVVNHPKKNRNAGGKGKCIIY